MEERVRGEEVFVCQPQWLVDLPGQLASYGTPLLESSPYSLPSGARKKKFGELVLLCDEKLAARNAERLRIPLTCSSEGYGSLNTGTSSLKWPIS
jgi:hypothetical protein